MIAGHESVTSGDILLEGRNITHLPAAARGTAMMFQSFALFPHLSALDNVAFSLKMKGVGKDRAPHEGGQNCWSVWPWATWPSASPASCQAASSSAWRWRAP
jgi:ABC-type sugar transport system ATPase subunit